MLDNKRTLVVAAGLLAIVLFSLGGASAECYNLENKSTFSGEQAIVLCNGTYSEQVKISNVTGADGFTLDCDEATVAGGLVASNVSKIEIKNCIFESKVSLSNIVIGATLKDNQFKSGGATASDSLRLIASGNKFEGSDVGLHLKSVESGVVKDNEFLRNTKVGLLLTNSAEFGVYKNVFEKEPGSDAVLAKLVGANSTGTSWSSDELGNYWSDYDGSDTDENGIGDVPYEIKSEGGAPPAKDEYPSMSKDFKIIASELTERSGKYSLEVSQGVKFTCGNTSYSLSLTQIAPEIIAKVNSKALTLSRFSETPDVYDLDGDKKDDISIDVLAFSRNDVDIKLTRQNPCLCGDGKCVTGENYKTCPDDCEMGQAEADDDGDGYTIAAGDCDDSDASIYPGAEEQCSASIDYDCDGLLGEEDPDCQGMGFAFWFFLVIFLLAGGAAAYFYFFFKGRGKKESEEPVEELPEEELEPASAEGAPSGKVKQIMEYAENYLEKGQSLDEAKETLEAQGWDPSDVDEALAHISKEGAAGKSEKLAKLKKMVKRDLDAGKDPAKIRQALKDKGWDKKTIDSILKDVKKE